jgi:hypothetical protein
MAGIYGNNAEDNHNERLLNNYLGSFYCDDEDEGVIGQDIDDPIDITTGYLYESGDFEADKITYKKDQWRRA